MTRQRTVRGPGVLALVAMLLLAFAPSIARASTVAPETTYSFPSAASTVIASVGFLNADEIGYFWSHARGDSVSQTFAGPASVNGVGLKVTVVQNVLNSGAYVDWSLTINGVEVGRLHVAQGFTGVMTVKRAFPPIAGPNYDVALSVVNEVAGGQGSITLAYAGSYAHGLILRAA